MTRQTTVKTNFGAKNPESLQIVASDISRLRLVFSPYTPFILDFLNVFSCITHCIGVFLRILQLKRV